MSDSRPHVVLVACMLTFAGFSAYLIAPASVIPLLVERFGIDSARAGAAVSAAYLGWLLLQLPSGVLMDRYDNRTLLSVAVVVFVVAAVAGAFARTYLEFLVSRGVAGASAGVLWGVGVNVVGGAFPAGRRDVATGVFTASGPLGFVIGQVASPLMAGWFGLQAAVQVYAALSVAGYGLFRIGFRDEVQSGDAVSFEELLDVLSARSVLFLAFSGLCANALWLFVNSWMPTYGVEELALPLATVGGLMALAPIAGVLARSGGGVTANWIGRRPTIAGTLLLSIPIILGFQLAATSVRFGIGLLLAGFALQFPTGVYYVYVQELVDTELSGTGISTMTTFQLVGGMTAPVVGGWLIDAGSWETAFGVFGVAGVLGAASVLLLSDPRSPAGASG